MTSGGLNDAHSVLTIVSKYESKMALRRGKMTSGGLNATHSVLAIVSKYQSKMALWTQIFAVKTSTRYPADLKAGLRIIVR